MSFKPKKDPGGESQPSRVRPSDRRLAAVDGLVPDVRHRKSIAAPLSRLTCIGLGPMTATF